MAEALAFSGDLRLGAKDSGLRVQRFVFGMMQAEADKKIKRKRKLRTLLGV